MALTSLTSLLYFLPAVIPIYHLLFFSRRLQNLFLLLAGLFFYAWGDPMLLILLGFLVLGNYVLAFQADRARKKNLPVRWIFVALCVVNLGPLAIFRYVQSLSNTLVDLADIQLLTTNIVAPLGISFLALSGISYVMDIYNGTAPLERNILHTALYITYFPPLAAGPLLRYQDMAAQIDRRKMDWDGVAQGVCRFVVGLGKVVLLATPLSAMVDIVFETSSRSGLYTSVPVLMALLGLIGFALEIYHYCSGFSDMALGLGRIFGFVHPENFNYPIMALSVTEYWHRCYRSLTTWFEEYVMRPMAPAQSRDKRIRATLVMCLAMGFWINPGIPSLIFGLWNFIFLMIEDITEFQDSPMKKGWRHVYVVVTMLLGLSCLRAISIYEFSLFIANLLGLNGNPLYNNMTLMLLEEFWPFLASGLFFLFPIAPWLKGKIAQGGAVARGIFTVLHGAALVCLLLLIWISLVQAGRLPSIVEDFSLWSWFNG